MQKYMQESKFFLLEKNKCRISKKQQYFEKLTPKSRLCEREWSTTEPAGL
jgi:hypothetical protein